MARRENILTQRRREAEVAKKVRLGEVVGIDTATPFPDSEKVWLLNLDMIEQHTGRVIDHVEVGRGAIGGSTVGFDKNCILYSKLRPNLNKVVLPDRDGVATSEILPLRCKSDKSAREFVSWYLRSPTFVSYAMSRTSGAKMPRLGAKELLNAMIPVPPLNAQKRIAAVLDKICELKKNAETRLEKLDTLVKSRFVEMFGDVEENPDSTLSDASDRVKVAFVGTCAKFYTDKGNGVPMIRTTNITKAGLDLTDIKYVTWDFHERNKKSQLHDGDILIARFGSNGLSCIYTGEPANCLNAIIIEPNRSRVLSVFLSELINSRYVQRQVERNLVGTTFSILNTKGLAKLRIAIPPLALQRKFAEFVEKVDKLREAARQTVEAMDTLYRSKLQEYFG